MDTVLQFTQTIPLWKLYWRQPVFQVGMPAGGPEELMVSLPSTQQLANETIQQAQKKYKAQFDRKA